MESWHCPLCHQRIEGRKSVARHLRHVWKSREDPTRCDAILRQTRVPLIVTTGEARVPDITHPITRPITLPVPVGASERSLARREPFGAQAQRQVRSGYTIEPRLTRSDTTGCRDFLFLQDTWDAYRGSVAALANTPFWQCFLPMHKLSGVAIDTALGNVKKVFISKTSPVYKGFHSSRRALYEKMSTIPSFWEQVMHTVSIDLSDFELPSGTQSIEFSFIDPIWGWLMAARKQHALDMHWKPVMSECNATYGGGVQFGECFRQAYRTCPQGAHVMAVSLHWDGTNEHRGLASTPICIGVSNCNKHDPGTQFCLSYMPTAPDDSPGFRKTPMSTEVKFSIRQQCIAAILAVLECAAEKGVLCRLRNQNGIEVERVLVPRLFATNLDQPEAQLFFGMLNRCCCSKCKRRKGYSAFRTGTGQDRSSVRRLYYFVCHGNAAQARVAREKLRRWGFNHKRRCCLVSGFDNLLVTVPGVHEVFPCVDFRDRMHGMIIFIHRTVTSLLDGLSKKLLSGPCRLRLERRLKYVCNRGCFRDPLTGHAYRKAKTIFSDAGMTAADKMCEIFLLPHVFGPDAEMLPQNARAPLLTILAHAQLLFLAVSANRRYTKTELGIIFDRGFKVLFGAAQQLQHIDYVQEVATCERLGNTPPPPLKRPKR